MAIFTKETSLPIVAAVIIYSLLSRRAVFFLVFCFELLIWLGIRLLAFGQLGGTGVFNASGLLGWAQRIVCLFFLPISYTTKADIKSLVVDGIARGSLAFYFINIVIWILFFRLLKNSYATLGSIKAKKGVTIGPGDATPHLQILFFTGVVFSALFFVLVGAENARFSYVFLLCFLGLLSAASPDLKVRKYILTLLIVTSFVPPLFSINKWAASRDVNQMIFNASRKLVGKMKELENFPRPVFIVNDFVGRYAEPELIAEFAGIEGTFSRGNSIVLGSCQLEEIRNISTKIDRSTENEISFEITIPQCANFVFEGADTPLLLEHLKDKHLSRNGRISYYFPELVRRKLPNIYGTEGVEDFGRVMNITIKKSAVMYYDFQSNEWVYLP